MTNLTRKQQYNKMSNTPIVYYNPDCTFCKLINGDIPSYKLIETQYSYSFLDIHPIAEAHIVIVPKYHGKYLHNISDQYLVDILPIAKRFAKTLRLQEDENGMGYNLLQNNGRISGQVVDHVHFHFIPKRDRETGLRIGWPAKTADKDTLKELQKHIMDSLEGNA
ncbi:uncharacterized protein NDAI_0A03050 [Naumovozyma dairenensis CBS 421]|uniref:HIT domain-containing protein n=1 Tax=Naumovozyma dairenensis (strain ATCC 10597 / BCRC 20456 / CBS 421 / NBRC 0211 / NRRL Y-12639) TaxID=1071378 RepID=G0W3S4_NAUDC|nr:hypothetical protein NDAI_0A03050 [Naumovozyma dairenensis CBS 421]CCD22462.1 hypothetical protein NDAI_0A03050 [Naumovozyma dairenensis CBS 421]